MFTPIVASFATYGILEYTPLAKMNDVELKHYLTVYFDKHNMAAIFAVAPATYEMLFNTIE